MYNKRRYEKSSNKKILHKIRKHWVVISSSLLLALGGGVAASQNVHAATPTANNNNNETTQHLNVSNTSNAATLVKDNANMAQQSSSTGINVSSMSDETVSSSATNQSQSSSVASNQASTSSNASQGSGFQSAQASVSSVSTTNLKARILKTNGLIHQDNQVNTDANDSTQTSAVAVGGTENDEDPTTFINNGVASVRDANQLNYALTHTGVNTINVMNNISMRNLMGVSDQDQSVDAVNPNLTINGQNAGTEIDFAGLNYNLHNNNAEVNNLSLYGTNQNGPISNGDLTYNNVNYTGAQLVSNPRNSVTISGSVNVNSGTQYHPDMIDSNVPESDAQLDSNHEDNIDAAAINFNSGSTYNGYTRNGNNVSIFNHETPDSNSSFVKIAKGATVNLHPGQTGSTKTYGLAVNGIGTVNKATVLNDAAQNVNNMLNAQLNAGNGMVGAANPLSALSSLINPNKYNSAPNISISGLLNIVPSIGKKIAGDLFAPHSFLKVMGGMFNAKYAGNIANSIIKLSTKALSNILNSSIFTKPFQMVQSFVANNPIMKQITNGAFKVFKTIQGIVPWVTKALSITPSTAVSTIEDILTHIPGMSNVENIAKKICGGMTNILKPILPKQSSGSGFNIFNPSDWLNPSKWASGLSDLLNPAKWGSDIDNLVQQGASSLSGLIGKLIPGSSTVINNVSRAITNGVNGVTGVVSKVANSITGFIAKLLPGVKTMWVSASNFFTHFFATGLNSINSLESAHNPMDFINSLVKMGSGTFNDFINQFDNVAKEFHLPSLSGLSNLFHLPTLQSVSANGVNYATPEVGATEELQASNGNVISQLGNALSSAKQVANNVSGMITQSKAVPQGVQVSNGGSINTGVLNTNVPQPQPQPQPQPNPQPNPQPQSSGANNYSSIYNDYYVASYNASVVSGELNNVASGTNGSYAIRNDADAISEANSAISNDLNNPTNDALNAADDQVNEISNLAAQAYSTLYNYNYSRIYNANYGINYDSKVVNNVANMLIYNPSVSRDQALISQYQQAISEDFTHPTVTARANADHLLAKANQAAADAYNAYYNFL